MSWLFSQALVEKYSEDISSDGEPSVLLSGNPTQLAYLPPDKMTAFSRLSRFGMTFKHLTEDRGEELLTLYLEDFPVRTFPQPDEVPASKEPDPECGHTWQELLARYDPATSLWKTPQCSLLEDYIEFSETCPKWGLMHDGALYQQQTAVHPTEETGSGFWPTPVASDCIGGRSNTVHYKNQRFVRISQTTGTEFGAKLSGAYQLMTGNPLPESFSEWMMGWPLGWTDLKPLEMDKYRLWQQQHGDY
jgi:hypothetical protein